MVDLEDYEDTIPEGLDEPVEQAEPGLSNKTQEKIRGGVRSGADKLFSGDKKGSSKKGNEPEKEESGGTKEQAEKKQNDTAAGQDSPQQAGSGKPAPEASGSPQPAKQVEGEGGKNAGTDATVGAGGKTGGGATKLGSTLQSARQAGEALNTASDIAKNPEEAAEVAKQEAIRIAKEKAVDLAKENAKKIAEEKIKKELVKRGLEEAAKGGIKQGITALVGAISWEVILVVIIIFLIIGIIIFVIGFVLGMYLGAPSQSSVPGGVMGGGGVVYDGGEPSSAFIPVEGKFFPLAIKPTANFTKGSSRGFGDAREGGKRRHAGIDLIAPPGTPIRAIADGKIIRFGSFWGGTYMLLVDHGDFVINYGENSGMAPGLSVGSTVKAGQIIARVGRLNTGSSMLHFEMYTPGTTDNAHWYSTRPSNLMDPTDFINNLMEGFN